MNQETMNDLSLTEKQKAALVSLKDGAGLISAVTAAKLKAMGLVKASGRPNARGSTHVELTDTGKQAA
ncbi:hypothetical protein [Roseicitreum antarcticum]|uniref:hypothetical protein n=1 Tax=Roseicitreum antarcticum TaxID=564137 RepID=UPI001680704D|nr:hypothetical protein [Roseicitreum antarcticum]